MRLAFRASLAGAMLSLSSCLPNGQADVRLEPLRDLFDALGELDRGVVRDFLQPDRRIEALPTPKARLKAACARSLIVLKMPGGLRMAAATSQVLGWLDEFGGVARLGFRKVDATTLRNWESDYKRQLRKRGVAFTEQVCVEAICEQLSAACDGRCPERSWTSDSMCCRHQVAKTLIAEVLG